MRPGRMPSLGANMSAPAYVLVTDAEAEGFEPPVGCPTLAFKVCDLEFRTGRDRPDQQKASGQDDSARA
jgi:hypothetical protein